MNVKAVLFDLDDTLVIDEVVSRETFASVGRKAAAEYGVDADKFVHEAKRIARELWKVGPAHPYCRRIGISAFECLWGHFEGASEDLTRLREWARRYRVEAFSLALKGQDVDRQEAGELLARAFESERRRLQRLMPDARELLEELKPRYALALLTNGAPDLQREKIASSGLADFFQAVAVSGEHDIGKPKPEIFHRLLAELGVQANEAVMVGNSLERDIAGARNAGIYAIWIKVPGSEEHAETEPDATIHGLSELPAVLAGLQK